MYFQFLPKLYVISRFSVRERTGLRIKILEILRAMQEATFFDEW